MLLSAILSAAGQSALVGHGLVEGRGDDGLRNNVGLAGSVVPDSQALLGYGFALVWSSHSFLNTRLVSLEAYGRARG